MAKLFLSFIFLGVLTGPLHSYATDSLRFVHIGLDDGLSQSTIFDITQDKNGNMWFATYNGLNKYDGYEFEVYQHDEQNPHSIGSDIINTLFKDKTDRIWIGTPEGLSLYDADKDRFENFAYQKGEEVYPIKSIAEFDDTLLLLDTDKRLALFDRKERRFREDLLPEAFDSVSPTSINQQGDKIYIGSREGLYIYSIPQKDLQELSVKPLRGKNIRTLLQQSDTRLWVGTEGHGLFLVNPQTNQTVHYPHIPGQKGNVSSNYIRSLSLDSEQRLWVGTINSLNILDEKNDCFRTYGSDNIESGNLSQASVRTIFRDSQGGMWIGTYFGGINYYHPLKNRFRNLQFIANRNSLNNNVIGCIREDAQQRLWIGTNGGGLNCYNPQNGSFTYYTQKEGLGSNDVKAIYVDEANDLVYVGTHIGGLSIVHRKTGRIETIKERKNIYAIEPTGNGDLWISGIGLFLRFSPRTRTFTPIKTDRPALAFGITLIYRDSKRRLWIGGKNGIDTFRDDSQDLSHCQVFASEEPFGRKFVNCIYEAHDGIFWIGTRSGLYRFDEQKRETRQYTTAQGLLNNVVHAVQEDQTGKLWISTDKGLSYLQPQTEQFRNYSDIDRSQNNQFTENASCRTKNGQMYFGGINGITTFHPARLADNPYTPPVVITQLRLFNKPVHPGDATKILEKNISATDRITLTAKQKMFSLQFVVPNYVSGVDNTFAYMLKGYDSEWYYSNSLRTVSYSNLPQGTYHFLVKAANSDGQWNQTPTELEIVVLPVWYKTWWAVLLFAAIFCLIAIVTFRYFWTRKIMKAQILFERKDKERLREVNEMKLRFFINIAHELRTPLTLILAPVQELLRKADDRWMHRQLEYVERNTNRLLHLVNQLMDYRRAELGVFVLKVHRNNIHQVVEKNFLVFERLAQRKNILYKLNSEVANKELLCDPTYLELILNNLLSNAFKYTDEQQSITVTLREVENSLLLQVQDTGSGIPKEKQGKIFERFYQVGNTHVGSGIGLSLVQRLVELHHGRIELDSTEGVGSTFSIYLPSDEASYNPDEMGSAKSAEEDNKHSINPHHPFMPDHREDLAEEEEQTEQAEQRTEKKNILIVEDNPDILRYLSEELGGSFTVWEAKHGEEALEVLKDQEIDLILTDVMMPVMDGLQLCKQVKQNVRTCHIPVIILSAKADLKEQLEGLQAGADDYIPKPFSLAVVTTKIRNIFRMRYRAIQHYSKSLEIEPEKMALNPMDEELLNRAKEIVERHLDDIEFSTEVFAREMYMSRSGLHLKMKALTDESTYDFIRKIRFNEACKLLKEGRYSVSEISSRIGFNTSSYFSTSFKRYFGCLPTEYAKRKLN